MPDPQPGQGSDWPVQAADTIVRVVGQVRDKTTGPALKAARAVVYGLLGGLLGGVAAVLVAIAAVRGLDEGIRVLLDSRETWAAHGLVGLVFTLIGVFLWSRREARDAS